MVSAVLLIIVKELNLKYMKKIRMPIPMEIIIVSDTWAVPGTLPWPHSPGTLLLPAGPPHRAPTQ